MVNQYRVAVVGATGRGDYGHGLDTVWKEVPETSVVAVADEHEGGRELARKRLEAPAAYASYREMIERERPDIVAIGPRWIDQHFEMVHYCVERGIHVYMEKPFCRTLAEADALVQASEATHSRVAIAHQTRYCPIIPVVQKLIADGVLGAVLEIRARGKEDARGGAEDLWVLGSHMLNLMTVFAGQAQSCAAQLWQGGQPARPMDVVDGREGLGPLVGDHVQASYQFEGGISGFFASRKGQAANPSRFALQIFGSKGVIDYPSGYLPAVSLLTDGSWAPGRSGQAWKKVTSQGVDRPETLPGGNARGNVIAVQDLLTAIREHRQPLCSIYEGRQTVEMILGVFASHRRQQPVKLPLETRQQHPLTDWK
jgi:predicted dehydrogenase